MLKKLFIITIVLTGLFCAGFPESIFSQDIIQFGKSTIKDSLGYQVFNKSIKVNGNVNVKDKLYVGNATSSNSVEISSSSEDQLRLSFNDGQNYGYTDFTINDAGALCINSSYDNIYFGLPGLQFDNVHAGAYLLGSSTSLDDKSVLPNNVKKDSINTFKNGSKFVFDGTMGDFTFDMEGGVSGRDFSFRFNGNPSFIIEDGGYVNTVTGYKLNGGDINTAGILNNVGYLNQSQSWTGSNSFTGGMILNSGLKLKRTEVAVSSYNIGAGDIYLACRTAQTAITLNLPSASGNEGRIYFIKDEDGSAGINNITIEASGLERIDGMSNIILNRNYDKYSLISNGTGWSMIIY